MEENKDIAKLCSGFIDNKLVTVFDDTLYYNGIQFNKYSGRYVKKEYQKSNIIQFRCKNSRKDERFRKGKKNFCNGEIILETNNQRSRKGKSVRESGRQDTCPCVRTSANF